MSNPSVEDLLVWMNDRSRTQGWSAIVAYDRRKANELLAQLFIERFDSASYLPPISASLQAGSSIEHLYELTFSVPQLSFENASLSDSRARLTLDFVGGMVITERSVAGDSPMLNKVQRVLPLNSPQLTMSVPLGKEQGEVNGGVVTLDISAADQFKANFVISSLDQEAIGRRFQLYFKDEVSDEQKRYPLGTLTDENGVLTPDAFDIRTMPAPGATLKGASNYSDGAVILFVKLRDGSSGSFPGMDSDFLYPIPADAGDRQYSASLLLSSVTLFDKVLRPDIEADVGNGVRFKPYTGGDDLAWSLVATGGGFLNPGVSIWREMGKDESASLEADFNYHFSDPKGPMTLLPRVDHLELSWQTEFSTPYAYKWIKNGWWDKKKSGQLGCTSSAGINLTLKLDPSGTVHFQRADQRYAIQFTADQELEGYTHTSDWTGNSYLTDFLKEKIWSKFVSLLERVQLPAVDTFLVRNLLFPGHNALHLSEAYVPGDLALFGHIDPLRTRFKITPQRPLIEAGQKQTFKTEPAVADAIWSVRATDTADTDVGSIDTKGVYTAAPAAALVDGYQRVLISASGTLNGEPVTASALVSVVHGTVAVRPIFQVYDTEPILLSADTLGGQVPAWSLKHPDNGGSLSEGSGRECIYTKPPFDENKAPLYIDTVLAGNPASGTVSEAQLLVFNIEPTSTVVVSPASDPATGKLHLQFMTDNGPVDPDTVNATCQIITGGGSVSPAGVYQEPADATGVAVLAMVRQSMGTRVGYVVLPLPLRTYGELIMRVHAPPPKDTWSDYEALRT